MASISSNPINAADSQVTVHDLAKMIDHSLLHPTMTDAELIDGCKLAVQYDVAAICIKPYAVPMARELLAGSTVKLCTVVGFPHGNSHVENKLRETDLAIREGATEIDVVVNVGKVLSRDWTYVSDEIRQLNEYIVQQGAILKLIFENDFLPDDSFKIQLCQLCNRHRVAFAKTSTGYGFVKRENGMYSYNGATEHDLKLMRRECEPPVQIKAAGGVRTLDDLLRVRSWGVTRVGATATSAMLTEAARRL